MHQYKLSLKFFLTLLVLSNICWSQNLTLKGTVKGANNKKLAYVNIGIKNKNTGTISDENGSFSIRIQEENKSDSLSFSYVGYKQHTIKISDIVEKSISQFVLDQKLVSLDEVTIISKKTKEKKLGTTSYVSFVVGDVRADNNQNNNIQEFAKKLKIKKPSKLLDVSIALSNVNIDAAKFRINFYSIKDNLPFEKIGASNIIIEKQIINGWNTFDLKKFDLKYETPVFIAIEYLPQEYNEQAPFNYNGQLLGRAVGRSSSVGNWNVTKGAKISMYVTVRQ
ncbi:carboxypeptidase-like regulatory domain-containing protein [Aquimarina sp. AD1]|uniref:carboxypeptidase-like regulatory domain-containing protein n=1 Tax=Aquimarina sp. (strain AD1) TaxID=1714848 RepID=UPI000E4BAF81|nr:carboxypeptidase-like regulatory domain-containing protein [Aquimarina sp. AD1]AXT54470.1 carboxypeptidase-like regulatory domain-containing protein [Aquimarina sp. AD1]RKN08911.1 carboxypeptidase-like regulatory domain-containing protein [Aquimarina sp. AD1]